MKPFFIFVLFAFGVQAQNISLTNAPAPHTPTEITSASADFDLTARVAVYRGRVYVNDPEVKLWCELLTVSLPSAGGHVNHLQAETNVVIDFVDSKGQTNHLTAAKAVYTYNVVNAVTNETVVFTGSPGQTPVVQTAEATITAEPIEWDRASAHLRFTNPHMKSKQNLSTGGGTNASPAKLY